MNSLKWLVVASLVNLVSNVLGAILAVRNNLTADFGGFLSGQDVLRDFLGFKGTALSAPLSFLLIQLVLIILAIRPARLGKIGVGGLLFVGLFYTLAQLGEPIVLQVWSTGGFDPVQVAVLFLNIASAIAMFVLGIQAWKAMRASTSITDKQ
jgi:hypothetical protein